MAICLHVKLECLDHCFHSIPHERVRMCRDGVCPVTLRRCDCTDNPPLNRDRGKIELKIKQRGKTL